jgi:alkylated DNA nucleotide flippase Atl1
MKAGETTFQQLIQGEKQFVVPLYQRPYSWQEPQLRQLWTDILEQTEALGAGESSSHFIGSVVLAPSPEIRAAGVQRWVVVDGQQRLTTLMLLLCAIRDHVAPADPQERERLNDLYLTNKWRSGDDEYYRLVPTQEDRAAFIACVRELPEAGGGDGIGAAYRFFQRMLVEADDPADPHDVARIETVVRERLSIVEISASRDDNVYRIFESLNNTGLRLSQADLVRNYLFMCLPTRGDEVYVSQWLPMQKILSPEQLETLMYLDLVLRGDEKVRREDLYRGHQNRIREFGENEEAVAAYVGELGARARLLQHIVDPATEPSSAVRVGFQRLNRWQALVVYPALMALLERREAGGASDDQVRDAIGLIESFLVRRMLNAVHSGNLNRIFQALVAQIQSGEDVVATTRVALSGTRLYWPTDNELREAIRAKPFYWMGRQDQRRFVLRRLEESFPSHERADLDTDKLTIEHVMPQTLTDEWLTVVAEDGTSDDDPIALAGRLTHTLGNLTLTGYNTELSNSPFSEKRELLAQSNLEMNRPIATKERWGPKDILERADDLAERAIAIWPGPDESVRGKVAGRDWELLHQALAALPAGSWTSYRDLAELVGSHPVPVGVHIARTRVVNGHRALSLDGRISKGFHWYDLDDTRDPVEVLREEGVRFDEDGRAALAQRVTATELAALVGLSEGDVATDSAPDTSTPDIPVLEERHERFLEQLGERDGPAASGAVARLLEQWEKDGGYLAFGSSATTSCFLMFSREDGQTIWPLVIYPGSTVEVVFQYLRERPPFNDPALRGELRSRLNQAAEIDIPLAKLELRPSFRVSTLADPEVWAVVAAALAWFIQTVRASEPVIA